MTTKYFEYYISHGGCRKWSCLEVRAFLEAIALLLQYVPDVADFDSPDGDIIDCVHITKQPAFDHPLLKNHTIQMWPSYHPQGLHLDSKVASHPFPQTWQQNGKCPENTIPIRRTQEEDVLRASSVSCYGKKRPKYIDNNAQSATTGHQGNNTSYYGTQATFNLWQPKVEPAEDFSLSQLWITRFVQTNNKIAIGGSISQLSPISTYVGPQYDITILVWKDPKQGNWWLQVGNDVLGYWPSSIFTHLAASATTMSEHQRHRWAEGFGKASYIRNIQVVDSSYTLQSPSGLDLFASRPNCYNVLNGSAGIKFGTYIYYGGPGRNTNCQ
ncbi:hypothetical protein BS78_05G268900 [Paspalum vaginatum]|nr:hypothetical protein BS78_05G268900 [Paspalum vaginatum]